MPTELTQIFLKEVLKMKEKQISTAELLLKVVEENQTRKILDILNSSKDIEEAKENIKALIN